MPRWPGFLYFVPEPPLPLFPKEGDSIPLLKGG